MMIYNPDNFSCTEISEAKLDSILLSGIRMLILTDFDKYEAACLQICQQNYGSLHTGLPDFNEGKRLVPFIYMLVTRPAAYSQHTVFPGSHFLQNSNFYSDSQKAQLQVEL